MSDQALALVPDQKRTAEVDLTAIERVIVAGDLGKLTPDERWEYYKGVCRSVSLNPFTQPFLYITLSGKLVLYATKGAADQLRDNHHISISQPKVDLSDGLCIVTVTATDRSGRTDSDLGIVPCENLRGDAKANAILKAVTKAKRRVTLSMCGLGMLDETEVETIPSARPVDFPVLPPGATSGPTIIDPRTSTEDAAVMQAEAVARWSGKGAQIERDARESVAADMAPPPAGPKDRATFEANWTKGVARAVACGVAPDDKPGPNATSAEMKKALLDLLETIKARETLNRAFAEKRAQAAALGESTADVDPAKATDRELHEMLATLDDLIASASGQPGPDDDDDAPF